MRLNLLRSLLAALAIFGLTGNLPLPSYHLAGQAAEEDFPSEERDEQSLRKASPRSYRSRAKRLAVRFAGMLQQRPASQKENLLPRLNHRPLSWFGHRPSSPLSLLQVLRI